MSETIEVVPAVLRNTWEGIQEDWAKVEHLSNHIQLDVTDGVFAGDGTFREVREFKKLSSSEKIELHMMVQTPGDFVDDVIDLNPARCIFHLEAFAGTNDIEFVYEKLRQDTQTELALAISPGSPTERLEEHLALVDYVLFMGIEAGWGGQPIIPQVFPKIGQFHGEHPDVRIAVDGHVGPDTIEDFVKAGARILCANSAIFKGGDVKENYKQLELLARSALL